MRRIVLIQPRRDGRVFGKSPGSPYTLMRLASLVPDEIPVEIWDENVRDLDLASLREGDLVGITSMTVTIEGAEQIARRAMKQGAGVVLGGVHATLMPMHTTTFAHSVMVGEGYFTWQQVIKDYAAEGIKGGSVDVMKKLTAFDQSVDAATKKEADLIEGVNKFCAN